MDVRSPIGVLLAVLLWAGAVHLVIGWGSMIDGLRSGGDAQVVVTATPGATTVSVLSQVLRTRSGRDASAIVPYVLTGSWPLEPVEATVLLDDRRLGTAPILDRPVEPGLRAVVVSRSGFIPESVTFAAQADAAHKVSLVLFEAGEHGPRERYLSEAAFFGRFRFAYLGAVILVAAFHAMSLLLGFGRRFGLRLFLAIVHLALVAVLLVPATRLLVAMDLAPVFAGVLTVLLLVFAPLGLVPARSRE
jgi:hypothetical protein